MTAREKEARRRNREIQAINKKLTVASQLALSVKKGVLYQKTHDAEGKEEEIPFQQNIVCSTHGAAMQISDEQLADLMQ